MGRKRFVICYYLSRSGRVSARPIFAVCDCRGRERRVGADAAGAGHYYRTPQADPVQSGQPYQYHRQAAGRRYPDSRGNC
jgi:hypothetical protein